MTQTVKVPFDNSARTQLSIALLLLRLGIASVMAIWAIDKLMNPGHAAKVAEKFYLFPGLTASMSYAAGVAQALVVIAFILGLFRTWSYGLVTLMHTVSVVSSWKQYLDPWTYPHILFYAAIPMLSACIALWMLRRFDTLSLDGCWQGKPVEATA